MCEKWVLTWLCHLLAVWSRAGHLSSTQNLIPSHHPTATTLSSHWDHHNTCCLSSHPHGLESTQQPEQAWKSSQILSLFCSISPVVPLSLRGKVKCIQWPGRFLKIRHCLLLISSRTTQAPVHPAPHAILTFLEPAVCCCLLQNIGMSSSLLFSVPGTLSLQLAQIPPPLLPQLCLNVAFSVSPTSCLKLQPH